MSKGSQAFSILFWLNRQRCKNEMPAIYLRLTLDNKRIELATRQYVDPKLWNQAAQCVKGNSEEAKTINRQLLMMEAELHKHYSYLLALDKSVDFEFLTAYLFFLW